VFTALTYCCCRYWQFVAGAKTSAVEAVERRVSETSSFALNLFRGQIRPEEVFPFRDGNCFILVWISVFVDLCHICFIMLTLTLNFIIIIIIMSMP